MDQKQLLNRAIKSAAVNKTAVEDRGPFANME